MFFSTRGVDVPLVPSHDVTAHRTATSRIEAELKPLRQAKKDIEAPYLKQLVDAEIAQLPEYLQKAWNTPPAERTEGQRLNVAQIEKTLQSDSLRARITEKHLVPLMPDDVRRQHQGVKDKTPRSRRPCRRAMPRRGRSPRADDRQHRRTSCTAEVSTRRDRS